MLLAGVAADPLGAPKIHANSFNSAQVASKLFIVVVFVVFIGCIKHDMPSQSRAAKPKLGTPCLPSLSISYCAHRFLRPAAFSFSFCLFCDDILNVPRRISFVLLRLFTFVPVLPLVVAAIASVAVVVASVAAAATAVLMHVSFSHRSLQSS